MVDGTLTTGTVDCELDVAAVSGRSLKLNLVDTVEADGTTTANHLASNVNYTLTLANVPTPVGNSG